MHSPSRITSIYAFTWLVYKSFVTVHIYPFPIYIIPDGPWTDRTVLLHTKLHFLTPYIDPAVAAVMAILLIREPVVVIFQSIKNLVLFAPEEEVLSQIRSIVDKHMKDYPYEVTFLDVIQTGRKIWVDDVQDRLRKLESS